MKAFHSIAIPHDDILHGKLTMDIFAADLWEVTHDRGPAEYRDPDIFFEKTYVTQGLETLVGVVKKRISGKGGDAVIQIQTPFGGGKTHSLIALYHKAAEWGAKRAVVVGTAMDTQQTFWSLIEEQLTGQVSEFSDRTAPGRDRIKNLLQNHQPLVILMDEILQYQTKATGVEVGQSTLAAQTAAFLQELTEVAGILENTCVVMTLPSSLLEHYDQGAERLYTQLQKVVGRVEKVFTPVREQEITNVIRKRLFTDIDDSAAKETVQGFMEYGDKENLIPKGTLPTEYRDRFLDSFPFIPEVVDTLYKRWGSYPTFQRTRGVLRLLSMVVSSLIDASKPYISLSDFDLSEQGIRQELLKHIGQEYNSVVDADIVGENSNAAKADKELGKAYRGYSLGSRAATAVFMYSFSGGKERGVTTDTIKRCATSVDIPASAVAEAVDKLEARLFYLQNVGNKYFFSNQPNLNRILLTLMENVGSKQVKEKELDLLRKSIDGSPLKVFLWETNSSDIPNSEKLKLVVMRNEDQGVMKEIVEKKGQTPRVYQNTIFFLTPLESERYGFAEDVKRSIAYNHLLEDESRNLSEQQRKRVKKECEKAERDLEQSIRRLYRKLFVPVKDGLREYDLGIPTYGERRGIAEEVYEKLRSEGEILEKIAPLVIKEKYLRKNKVVHTKKLYESSVRTPGEARPVDREVVQSGIMQGVEKGLFGLGELENGNPICHYFNERATVAFSDKEVLIEQEICKQQEQAGAEVPPTPTGVQVEEDTGTEEESPPETPPVSEKLIKQLELRFDVPKGKVSGIMGIMNLLQSKFRTMELELSVKDGGISERDYRNKILEAFRQLGIDIKKEESI